LSALAEKRCVPCDGNTPPIRTEEAKKYLRGLSGWNLTENEIFKEFRFGKYLDGLEFAYALGKIAEREDHHPDILVKWRRVRVTWSTHAIKGLSENDFIMAAKTERLFSAKAWTRKTVRQKRP